MEETTAQVTTGSRTPWHLPALLVGTSAAVLVVGSFLPWLYSGERARSSFELVTVARRLGLSPEGWQGAALRLWPLVPLLCVLATFASWWGKHLVAAVLADLAALATAWLCIEALTADLGANLRLGVGPSVTVVGAALLFLTGPVGLVVQARARR